jgi:hypothetical protein
MLKLQLVATLLTAGTLVSSAWRGLQNIDALVQATRALPGALSDRLALVGHSRRPPFFILRAMHSSR